MVNNKINPIRKLALVSMLALSGASSIFGCGNRKFESDVSLHGENLTESAKKENENKEIINNISNHFGECGKIRNRKEPYVNPTSGGKTRYSTACNGAEDCNHNNILEPNELRSRDTFNLSNEKIIAFVTGPMEWREKLPSSIDSIEVRIYNPTGELLTRKRKENARTLITRWGDKIIRDFNYVELFEYLPEELKKAGAKGRCTIEFYVGDTKTDSYKVNFTE